MKTKLGRYSKDHHSDAGIVYIPAKLASDSGFPIKPGTVRVWVNGERIIIEPADSSV